MFDHSPSPLPPASSPASSPAHCQPFSVSVCLLTLSTPSYTEAPSLEISSPHLGRSLSSVPRLDCCDQAPLPSSHICNPDLSKQRALTADYKQSVARLVQHRRKEGRKERHWRHFKRFSDSSAKCKITPSCSKVLVLYHVSSLHVSYLCFNTRHW